MEQQQRTLLAIVISIAVIFGWYWIFPPPEPEIQNPTGSEVVEKIKESASISGTSEPVADALPLLPEEVNDTAVAKDILIETNRYRAIIDTKGGILKSLLLKDYQHFKTGISLAQWVPFLEDFLGKIKPSRETEDNLVQMIKTDFIDQAPPLGVLFSQNEDISQLFQRAVFTSSADSVLIDSNGSSQILTLTSPIRSGIQIVKSLTFHADSHVIDYRVNVINRNEGNKTLDIRHMFGEGFISEVNVGQRSHVGAAYVFDGSVETIDTDDLLITPSRISQMEWLGVEDAYFISAAVGVSTVQGGFFEAFTKSGTGGNYVTPIFGMELPPVDLQSGKQIESSFKLYYGPKKEEEMLKFGHNLQLSLDMWLESLAAPLLSILGWIHSYVGNYGVSIILLTVLVRLVLFPLTYKGSKSMKRMQQLQPKMLKIRERYKNDKEKLNAEMMGLYRKNKVNPVGGCLPLLLQMPVFFALYSALSAAVDLRHEPFMGWIADLSAPDGLGITPIAMGISMYGVQKMTPTGMMDPTQAKIMAMLPFIFTIFSFTFPTGLTLYWVTSNILSIGQQYFINRIKLPEVLD